MYKLSIELVPKTCWFSNLRDHLSSSEWNKVKKNTFNKANNRCEICLGVGRKWPVECHEIWYYNDLSNIQTLKGTIALCPNCHMVKHIGYALVSGKFEIARCHLKKINNLTFEETDFYIENCFKVFENRSKKNWKLDIEWINKEYGFNILKKR